MHSVFIKHGLLNLLHFLSPSVLLEVLFLRPKTSLISLLDGGKVESWSAKWASRNEPHQGNSFHLDENTTDHLLLTCLACADDFFIKEGRRIGWNKVSLWHFEKFVCFWPVIYFFKNGTWYGCFWHNMVAFCKSEEMFGSRPIYFTPTTQCQMAFP